MKKSDDKDRRRGEKEKDKEKERWRREKDKDKDKDNDRDSSLRQVQRRKKIEKKRTSKKIFFVTLGSISLRLTFSSPLGFTLTTYCQNLTFANFSLQQIRKFNFSSFLLSFFLIFFFVCLCLFLCLSLSLIFSYLIFFMRPCMSKRPYPSA